MDEPPYPHDETLRLKSLHSLKILDTQPEERFDRITRLARNIFDVPIALVSLVDGDRQWFKSSVGLDASQTPRNISFCGHAIIGTEVFVISNTEQDRRFCDNPLVVNDPSIRFYAGYPLRAPNGTRLGTLCIIDRKIREFSDRDAETLTSLGQMVEAELFTVTVATTDELTGLTNRRGFMTVAPFALNLCERNEQAATVLGLDLNGFKAINDDLGHQEGDLALIEFGRCFIKSCRESDIVARLGGDEFCGLFIGTSLAELDPIVTRLGDQVAAMNTKRDPRYPITFSAGAASYRPGQKPDLKALMRAADDAMYLNKKQSRTAAGAADNYSAL